jgi:hypothetical protein
MPEGTGFAITTTELDIDSGECVLIHLPSTWPWKYLRCAIQEVMPDFRKPCVS